MLSEITRLQIPYLQKLDYIDLKNLCQTDQYYRNICTNKGLKDILYSKNENIIIDPSINVKNVLDELDHAVENFYYESYPRDFKFPSYIDKDKFKDYIKKIIYKEIYLQLFFVTTEYFENDLRDVFPVKGNTFIISLETGDIATPFMLDIKYGNDEKAEKVAVYYETELPASLLDYMNNSVTKYMKLYDESLRTPTYADNFAIGLSDLLSDLLFVER